MPISKVYTVISNNISLTPGGGTTTTTAITTNSGWHKTVYIKMTNGATAPTTPASARLEASPDNTNFYVYQEQEFAGPTTSGGIKSYSPLILASVQYQRIVWTHGIGGSAITARAELAEIAEMSDSVTSVSGTALVGTADTANTAERVNIYNEAASSFAHNQTTIGVTSVQLAANTCAKGVLIKALSSNTGIIYAGGSGVTTANGFELGAGDSIFISVNNSNLVYCIATIAAQAVCFLAI